MTKTKKQHYVPQFLLRRFASHSKKNPQLWVLDKKTNNLRLSSVRDSGHENQFYKYSHTDGVQIDLEPLMADIDSAGSSLVKKILATNMIPSSSDDMAILAIFLACQMYRTPMVRNDMENFRKMIVHKWGPNIRMSETEKPIGEYGPEDAKLSSLLSIQDVPEFAELLLSKVWTLVQAPSRYPFIIGDNPVVRHNMIDRGPRGNLGINNTGIEVYMPLSPAISIHILCPTLADAVSRTPGLAEDFHVAMSNGTPMKLLQENVEFANSLQVIWAERFVYGKERHHLDIPVDMLRTNPELAVGPGVRPRPDEG